MKKIKVSIIVPVYNTEKYLKKCLDSLVKQTLKDIEIIVVNDGTKDNSQIIIDKYVEKYPNLIKSYIKKNGGLSSARNYGLKYAKGEYIAFVDSDDWVEKNKYELMYKKAKEQNFDVVCCNFYSIYNNNVKIENLNIEENLLSKEEIKNKMKHINIAVWNKIYKRNLFNCVKFKEGILYEDIDFTYKLIPHIKSIGFLKQPLYNYVKRENSISNMLDKKVFQFCYNLNGVINYYKQKGFFDYYKLELEYIYVRILYVRGVKKLLLPHNKKIYNKYIDLVIYNVKKQFPNYRKNKNFYKDLNTLYCLFFNKIVANILFFLIRDKKYNKNLIK